MLYLLKAWKTNGEWSEWQLHKTLMFFVLQLIHVEAMHLELGSLDENRLDWHFLDPDLECHRDHKFSENILKTRSILMPIFPSIWRPSWIFQFSKESQFYTYNPDLVYHRDHNSIKTNCVGPTLLLLLIPCPDLVEILEFFKFSRGASLVLFKSWFGLSKSPKIH